MIERIFKKYPSKNDVIFTQIVSRDDEYSQSFHGVSYRF